MIFPASKALNAIGKMSQKRPNLDTQKELHLRELQQKEDRLLEGCYQCGIDIHDASNWMIAWNHDIIPDGTSLCIDCFDLLPSIPMDGEKITSCTKCLSTNIWLHPIALSCPQCNWYTDELFEIIWKVYIDTWETIHLNMESEIQWMNIE